ncbi:phosphoenolpyruvate carboxykinase [GTP]-like [Hyalella azteca]|uniref:Phosphoenolpyruvate carboxykinase [GTP]-like n=1 Tax=Hyalella azteca TaxID=294128 RepID=A0A979FT59_HYAAZ|nr:phosphoenolpyruvate carboxykinase [GTP]-like [Hyalella azteca]
MEKANRCMPKIFHVNWFRKGANGFLWPGFGDNVRVVDWILQRIDGKDVAVESAIGLIPRPGSLNLEGLKEDVDMDELFKLPKDFWQKEIRDVSTYFQNQVGEDLPNEIWDELCKLEKRVEEM